MVYENTLKRDKDNVFKKENNNSNNTTRNFYETTKRRIEVLLFQRFPHILYTTRLKIKIEEKNHKNSI